MSTFFHVAFGIVLSLAAFRGAVWLNGKVRRRPCSTRCSWR